MGLKLEDLIQAAKNQGWDVPETTDGFMFRPADRTKTAYSVHRNPPDYSLKVILSQLRRRGLIYSPQKGTQ